MLSALAIVAASLLAACPEVPADPTEVAPDSTTAVLGVDVDAFVQTSTGAALVAALGADLEFAEAQEIASDCGLQLANTYALVLARDHADGRMLAVQARTLGEPATLDCLAAELRARNDGAEPWVVDSAGCFTSLALADGSQIWVLNKFTLVWARGSMVEPIAAKLSGATPIGLPHGLDPEFARLDRSKHAWLAAKLSAEDRQTLPVAWAREAESLTVAVDLSVGLRAVVSISTGTATALASARDRLLASFVAVAERLDDAGVEHRLRERARVGIVGAVLAAEIELDEGELRAIRTKIGEHIRGRGVF